MAGQSGFYPQPQRGRLLDEFVAQRLKKLRKLFLRPIEHILSKQATTGSKLSQHDGCGTAQHAPHLVELPRQQASEDSMHVARCIKVSRLAELPGLTRIVAEFRMIKAKLHVPRKANRSTLEDFLLDDAAQFVQSPFRCRSARSCGVRMNISTK